MRSTEWPVEAEHDGFQYVIRIEGADTPSGWWWISGMRWFWRLFDDGGADGWELRVRRREDDPSGGVVYAEFVPSWDEGWERARELGRAVGRGEVVFPG